MDFTDGLLLGACGAWLATVWARYVGDLIRTHRRRTDSATLFRRWERSASVFVAEKLTAAEKSAIRESFYR